jgi:chromosome segregation ATPase
MAKLNESKRSERELRSTLGATEQRCAELEDKAGHTDKLAKSMQALQNTIDHLESRLEIANAERLDAEEQLSNLREERSPFDVALPKVQVVSKDAHMSMSTVFSSSSPLGLEIDSQENSTLAAFVAHIERLQDQVREKDVHITELAEDRALLQQRHSQLDQEYNVLALQSDTQNDLLRKTRRAGTHVERLRAAIIDREAIIGEKEKTIQAVERQLEYHKLLLQAEIRRHAAMKLHIVAEEDDPLPELTSLAKREDIDKWMSKLNERLRKEHPSGDRKASASMSEAEMESLRREVDFYVREIIYFKLDIKGYKSDIRKLKRATAQLGSRASDVDSEASSLRPAATPIRSRFASTTPELGASNTTSPILEDIAFTPTSTERAITPTPSAPVRSTACVTTESKDMSLPRPLELEIPTPPQNFTHKAGSDMVDEGDRVDSGISPCSNVPLSTDRRKPTV